MRPIVAARVAWPVGLSVRSICRLGCGLGLAEASTSSIAFARCCQCALMGEHIGASRPIRSNHLSAAAMRPYVKLLSPLVVMIIPFPPVDNIWAMMTVQQRIREKIIKLFYAVLCVRIITCAVKLTHTRMWANAQPDGRPAEHRWRPLFNAPKFGWRPLLDAVQ